MKEEIPQAEDLIAAIELAGDRQFVQDRTARMSLEEKDAVLEEYFRQWRVAASNEPVSFKKANAGRYTANTWLLNRMERSA